MAPKFDFAKDGLKKLDEYLLTRTYLEGWKISEADKTLFSTVPAIDASTYPHASRWYLHIAALTGGMVAAVPAVAPKASKKDEEDDFDDLFGDDDEAPADDLAEKKRKALEAAKAKKDADKKKRSFSDCS